MFRCVEQAQAAASWGGRTAVLASSRLRVVSCVSEARTARSRSVFVAKKKRPSCRKSTCLPTRGSLLKPRHPAKTVTIKPFHLPPPSLRKSTSSARRKQADYTQRCSRAAATCSSRRGGSRRPGETEDHGPSMSQTWRIAAPLLTVGGARAHHLLADSSDTTHTKNKTLSSRTERPP